MFRFRRIVALLLCAGAFCLDAQQRTQTPVPAATWTGPHPGHYLFAWTGDASNRGNDFLAVIDADPESPTYGRLITT